MTEHVFIFSFFVCLTFCSEITAQTKIKQDYIFIENEKATLRKCFENLQIQKNLILSYSPDKLNLNLEIQVEKGHILVEKYINLICDAAGLEWIWFDNKKIVFTLSSEEIHEDPLEIEHILITGIIRDGKTREALVGAYIFDSEKRNIGISNEIGQFHLNVPVTTRILFVSYIGYELKTFYLDSPNLSLLNIHLTPNSAIDEVLIKGISAAKHLADRSQNHFIQFPKLSDLSHNGTHTNPLTILHHLPGIQSGTEAHTGIYVRGGSPDQNLILVDGVPLYETMHALGFSSVIDGKAIKNMQVFKQAFPSRYGGKLSSVIDFQLKDGNKSTQSTTVHANTYQSGFFTEGPLVTDKASFFLSGRKSNVNYFIDDLMERFLNIENTNIDFEDLNAKIHYQVNPNHMVSVSGLYSSDRIFFNNTESFYKNENQAHIRNSDEFKWRNKFLSLNWSGILSSRVSGSFNLYTSSFQNNTNSGFQFESDTYLYGNDQEFNVFTQSHIKDRGVSGMVSIYGDNDLKIDLGASLIGHEFNPKILQSNSLLEPVVFGEPSEKAVKANEFSLYSEIQYALGSRQSITMGARLNQMDVIGKSYWSLEPRINYDFRLGEDSRISISYAEMTQFTHFLSNSGIGLPSELYLPSTLDLAPEKSRHLSISYAKHWKSGIQMQLSSYYKVFENVLEYNSPFELFRNFVNNETTALLFDENNNWQEFVSLGLGKSAGIEIAGNYSQKDIIVSLAYSLSKSDRIFDALNNGLPFPSKYDRRHDFSAQTNFRLGKGFSLTSQWIFGTGHPFSLAIEEFQSVDGNVYLVPNGINNFRFNTYHRLDLFCSYKTKNHRLNLFSVELGIRNVYNRKNTYYVYLFQHPLSGEFEFRQVSIFPFLPQFNIYFTF